MLFSGLKADVQGNDSFNREKVLSILDKAISYVSEHNGKLIDKPSLHTAIDRYRNIVREAGMNGKMRRTVYVTLTPAML